MNGINESLYNELTTEEKQQLLSELMMELTGVEKLKHQYEIEMRKYSNDLVSHAYANAENWIQFYESEIKRLSKQIDNLQRELLGEECPRVEEESQGDQNPGAVIKATHPDIRRIIDSFSTFE